MQPGCLKQLPHNLELPEPLAANLPQGLLASSGLRTFPDDKRGPNITFSVKVLLKNKQMTSHFQNLKEKGERGILFIFKSAVESNIIPMISKPDTVK